MTAAQKDAYWWPVPAVCYTETKKKSPVLGKPVFNRCVVGLPIFGMKVTFYKNI